jgi:hypothetical protein
LFWSIIKEDGKGVLSAIHVEYGESPLAIKKLPFAFQLKVERKIKSVEVGETLLVSTIEVGKAIAREVKLGLWKGDRSTSAVGKGG